MMMDERRKLLPEISRKVSAHTHSPCLQTVTASIVDIKYAGLDASMTIFEDRVILGSSAGLETKL